MREGECFMLGGMIMAKIEMTAQNKVVQVASTLAIENMYISERFRDELLLVAQNKKSSKDVLAELDRKYAR